MACNAPVSISSVASAPVDWAELLDSLLHEIIALFTSYHDLLTFSSTCRSWRAAFSSYPSKFTFPFLVLQPDRGPCPYNPYADNFSKTKWQLINGNKTPAESAASLGSGRGHILSNNGQLREGLSPLSQRFKWQLIDPTNPTSSIHCAARMYHKFLDNMDFVGCSQGCLIFSSREQCLLVDVVTGAKVRPPQLPYPYKCDIDCAILSAPLSLPNTYLLVCTKSSLFQWRVGSHAWSEQCLSNENIRQIVVFQGQIFAMNYLRSMCSVHLGQQLCLEEVAVASQLQCTKLMGVHYRPWLVVCGDMLLMVMLILDYHSKLARFEAFRLDLSVKPAMLVKVDKLENWALFVGTDSRSPTFAGMYPERWGGKSNYIYVAGSYKDSREPWFTIQLGEASRQMEEEFHCGRNGMWTGIFKNSMEPLWVFPSKISRVDHSTQYMANVAAGSSVIPRQQT